MELKGSKTERNLYKTFAAESRANTKYSLYAEKAKKEGYRWVAEVFDEIASNEKAHAREAFKRYLNKIGDTQENLKDAIKGEIKESTKIYKEFEEVARKEGFIQIANFYRELQEVEAEHAKRFSTLEDKIKNDTMFKSLDNSLWQCMNCGYIYEGKEAPVRCPVCKYPREYFKQYCRVK